MKRNVLFCLMFFSIIFFYSCTKESYYENSKEKVGSVLLNKTHFVSLEKALDIASLQRSTLTKGSSVGEYLEFRKSGDLTEFYIINYPNSGFVIISADERLTPILAYSDNSHFPLCDSVVPPGVTDWLNSTSAFIDSIRNTDMEQEEITKNNWQSVLSGKTSCFTKPTHASTTKGSYMAQFIYEWGENWNDQDCYGPGGPIAEYYYYVPELLQTTWEQGDGYNEMLPYAGCTSTANGRYLVGCVAVAVGQVMTYNAYPTSGFNWTEIYNNNLAYGTATNTFLRDIGQSGNLNINYGCDGSGGSESNAVNYLRSVGYNSATVMSGCPYNTVFNNLAYGFPVLLEGNDAYYTVGHMWVCDGIQSFYGIFCSGIPYETYHALNTQRQYYHMNWGWIAASYNGWYNYASPFLDFNTNRRMIYDIKY